MNSRAPVDVEALIDELMALSDKMAKEIRGDRPPPPTPDIDHLIRAELRAAITARLKEQGLSPMEESAQPPERPGDQSQG